MDSGKTSFMSVLERLKKHSTWGDVLDRLLDTSILGIRRGTDKAEEILSILNFLKGYSVFESRDEDIYVVSYPRSGTTWVQFILYQLTSDGNMDFYHLSEVSPWFERSLAQQTMQASDFASYRSPRILKSHLLPKWLPAEGRFLYVVRDSLDVAYSYYRFYCTHLRFNGTFNGFLEKFLTGDLQYGAWFHHVESWKTLTHRDNVMMVSYESLFENFDETVLRISEFCRIEVDDARLHRVRERCSFKYMKKHEQKFDHITALLMERGFRFGAFIREGKRGQGLKQHTDAQKEMFRERVRSSVPRSSLRDLGRFLH